jgi:pimeloyl-ACP methyl ester carboxylesterase
MSKRAKASDRPDPPVAGQPIELPTERGPVRCLYHRGRRGAGAVLMVGGTDGGFDGPADGIYATLAEGLSREGIAALRLSFRILRAPGPMGEGVFDVLAGVRFLEQEGAGPISLMGHSYGGAVVIEAAARSPAVSAVVTLSTQTAGARRAGLVAPRPLLIVHGAEDRRLPPYCSEQVYSWAGEPKELIILKGAKHSLRQRREELRRLLVDWLRLRAKAEQR